MSDNLYMVRDGDGDLYVVAPSFEAALKRWEDRLRAENAWPADAQLWPDEVHFLARGGDLVLPAPGIEVARLQESLRAAVLAMWPKTTEPLMPEVVAELPERIAGLKDEIQRRNATLDEAARLCGKREGKETTIEAIERVAREARSGRPS